MNAHLRWELFRAQLRKRRIDLHLTQKEVAVRMGRSQDYVSVLENNTAIPTLGTVWLWADALGLDILAVEKED